MLDRSPPSKERIDALDAGLVPLFDKLAPSFMLAQWISDFVFVFGASKKFWRELPYTEHAFNYCPLLIKHGKGLAEASRTHIEKLAKRKGVATLPGVHYLQAIKLLYQSNVLELPHARVLTGLAEKVTAEIWGIDRERLFGLITRDVAFGNLQPTESFAGELMRKGAAGYGGVVFDGEQMRVHARAWNFTLLIHELTKGTAELVCLHGLNRLDDRTYDLVTQEADRIEHEIWMLQAGGEFWRKFLLAVPATDLLADSLMQLARQEPKQVEQFAMDIIEHPMTARATLADWLAI